MEFQTIKKLNTVFIMLVIVALFSITHYMDTHGGKNPWSKGEIFNKTETQRYIPSYAQNNNQRYSNHNYNRNGNYVRTSYNTRRAVNQTSYQNYNTELPPDTAYIRRLHRDISPKWSEFNRNITEYPDNNVNIRIVIGKDGQILSSYIYRPSSSTDFDNSALAFVRSLAPFRQLPSNIENSVVKASLTFSRNSFGTSKF